MAAVAVVLSIPAFGFFALTPLFFCDSGPLSACFRWAAFIAGIPIVQVASLAIGWIFLHKRRYLRVSASLMILSALPAFLPIWFLANAMLQR
jgi:hypothetical protein